MTALAAPIAHGKGRRHVPIVRWRGTDPAASWGRFPRLPVAWSRGPIHTDRPAVDVRLALHAHIPWGPSGRGFAMTRMGREGLARPCPLEPS